MKLISCPKCGVVVNLDDMEELESTDDIAKHKDKLNVFFYSKEEYCSCFSGFHCPCCKEWVRIDID